MDVFEAHYYKINRVLLSIVGLWPYLDVKTRRIRTSFVTVVFTIIIFMQFFKALTSNLTASLLVEILSNLILCICILLVYIVAYMQKEKIRKIMDHIRVDWTKIESKEEYDIFKKYAKETRTYTVILFFFLYTSICSIVFFMLLPVLLDMIMPLNESRRYEILFPVEMFFDTSKYFHISFPIMFVCLYVLGSTSVAVYTMVLMFLQHCNGLFDLVGYIFENAIKDHQKTLTNTEEEKQIHGRLIRGIRFHERTIKFIATVNSICQTCYLIEIVLVGIVIAIDILRILQTPFTVENAKEIIACIFHIEGNLIWVFVNCYFGQRVIDHSSNVHTKVCNSKWYMSSTKVKKLILMIIARSMKPSHVSIGKIFISSMEFYISIVQTSVSYAMVISSLRQ